MPAISNLALESEERAVVPKRQCTSATWPERTPKKVTQTLVSIMHGGKTQAARARAAEALLDRGWGKAMQPMAVSGSEGEPLEIIVTVSFAVCSIASHCGFAWAMPWL